MQYTLCDKCGKRNEIDEDGFGEGFLKLAIFSGIDLCPDCQTGYWDIMAKHQKELKCWLGSTRIEVK